LRLTSFSAILVGVVGAAWSWHLLQWYTSANAITSCILGTQCPLVFQTSFSYFYGIPIHLLAVFWFSFLTAVAMVRAYGIETASKVGLIVGALSVPAVIYLDYIQFAVLHLICSDCELAHGLGLLLFALFALMYWNDRKDA
jgi:uncharacterized membrane protein